MTGISTTWPPPTVLPVLVTGLAIEDGQTPPPEIGAIGMFPLLFDELPADPDDPSIVTVRALAEPRRSGKPIRQHDHAGKAQGWAWPVMLRGTGWTATWHSPRPVVGEIELTGRLIGDLGYAAVGRIRGRVRRIWIAVARYRRVSEKSYPQWRPVPGPLRYREVTVAPRWFSSVTRPADPRIDPHSADSPTEGDHEVGVLVELDLVEIPAPPLRPSIVPAAVAADGADLWLADRELPLIIHLDGRRKVTEYQLPGQIFVDAPSPPRALWTHAGGCWVAGWDGIYHCAPDGVVHRSGDIPIRMAAAHGATLLAVSVPARGDAELFLLRPDQDPVTYHGAGWGDLKSLGAVDDGFLLLFEVRDPSTGAAGAARLIRMDLRGKVTHGEPLPTSMTFHRPFFTASPVTIVDRGSAVRVLDDLTLTDTAPLPGTILFGGQLGDRLWVVGHPPDGTGMGGWWPLPGPSDYSADHQYWLFTLLDAATRKPISSTPIRDPQPDVTIDGDGTVWLTAAGLQAIPPAHMTEPVPLDVAGLLDASRHR